MGSVKPNTKNSVEPDISLERQLSLVLNRKINGNPAPLGHVAKRLEAIRADAQKNKNRFVVKTVDYTFYAADVAMTAALKACLSERK